MAVEISGLSNVTSLSAGINSVCAVTQDKSVKCWGSNHYGELGNDTFIDSYYVPVTVAGLDQVVSISVGANRVCAVRTLGDVKCWGLKPTSENWDYEKIKIPESILELSDVKRVKVGDGVTCALLNSGRVKCWGVGNNLGTNSRFLSQPTEILGLQNVQFLMVSRDHGCVIQSTGQVACWGRYSIGSGGSSSTPVVIDGVQDVIQLVAGQNFSCAMERNKDVKCWGSDSGALIASDSVTPALIFANYQGISLSAGSTAMSCILGAFKRSVKCYDALEPTFGASGQFIKATP